MKTYLKDLTQSIGRYIWWTLMEKLVLGMFGSTSSISTSASMRGKGKLNMLEDP